MLEEDADYDELENMCGVCAKDFYECMCCACGSEDGHEYQEGIMCEECHTELIRGYEYE